MSEIRKLSTILFADIAGYTSLMQSDEPKAMQFLSSFKTELEKTVPSFGGQIVQYFGDACLLSFDSTSQGVQCAMKLQTAFLQEQIPIRIGMHLGEVIFKENNAFGDGVNIASRIESMGIPGAILVSKHVKDQIHNKAEFQLQSLGPFEFKNVEEPVEVFAIANTGFVIPKREEIQGKFKTPAAKKSSKWPVIIGSLVVLALISYWITQSKNSTSVSSDPDKEYAIAVLPFENIRVDEDKEWLGQNFTQNINSYISKVQKLRVIDSYSTRQFEDSDKSNTEIAEALGVSYILRGTVTQFTDQLSITVELIDVLSNTVVSSESYDEQFDDDFMALHREISQRIVSKLDVALNPREEAVLDNLLTVNQEANIYFNEAVRIADNRTGINDSLLAASATLLQKAIDLDPNYADAYAEKAFVLRMVSDDHEVFENMNKIKMVDSLAKKALEVDHNSARAYTVKGAVEFMQNVDFTKGKEYLDKSLAINPNNATAQHYMALYHSFKPESDHKKALEHITIAHKLNPFSKPITNTLIRESLAVGNIEEAEAILNKISHSLPGKGRELKKHIIDAKVERECIETKDWSKAISLYQQEIGLDSTNSILYSSLADAYRNILIDDVNYVKNAKKAYEIGKFHTQNQNEDGWSDNAYFYFISLLKTKQIKEAGHLMTDPYFTTLFDALAVQFYTFYYHYYSGDYEPAEESIESFAYVEPLELTLVHAQLKDQKTVRSILSKDVLNASQKAMVFAVLKEQDSMYYYMDKETDQMNILNLNGAVEMDPYRKEERYKAFLKKNFLPLTSRNK